MITAFQVLIAERRSEQRSSAKKLESSKQSEAKKETEIIQKAVAKASLEIKPSFATFNVNKYDLTNKIQIKTYILLRPDWRQLKRREQQIKLQTP